MTGQGGCRASSWAHCTACRSRPRRALSSEPRYKPRLPPLLPTQPPLLLHVNPAAGSTHRAAAGSAPRVREPISTRKSGQALPRGGAGGWCWGSGLSPARYPEACAPSSLLRPLPPRPGARGLGVACARCLGDPGSPAHGAWACLASVDLGFKPQRGGLSQNDLEVVVHLSYRAKALALVLQAGVWAEGCMPSASRPDVRPFFGGYRPWLKRKISV